MNANERRELEQLSAALQRSFQVIDALANRRNGAYSDMLHLTDRQQNFFIRYFGLGGRPQQSIREIAKHYGIAPESVRMTLNRCIGNFTLDGVQLRMNDDREWIGYTRGPQRNTVEQSRKAKR